MDNVGCVDSVWILFRIFFFAVFFFRFSPIFYATANIYDLLSANQGKVMQQ